MSVDKMIKENSEFISRTNEYYVNCYALNNDRISELARHSIDLRKKLIEAIERIQKLNQELEAIANKEIQL